MVDEKEIIEWLKDMIIESYQATLGKYIKDPNEEIELVYFPDMSILDNHNNNI